MATIKDATTNALAFAQDALGADRTLGMRLEEVESVTVNNVDYWRITLSMLVPPGETAASDVASAFAALSRRQSPRDYKTFMVRKSDGQVESMKIRELTGA